MELIDIAHDEREARISAEKTLEKVRKRVEELAESWHCWYMTKRPVVGEAKAAMGEYYELARMCGTTDEEIREIANRADTRANRILEIMQERGFSEGEQK